MNDVDLPTIAEARPPRSLRRAPGRDTPAPRPTAPRRSGGAGRQLLGLAVLALVIAALGIGVWQHYQQHREVAATAAQQADFVPSVRVGLVTQRHGTVQVSLPGTTLAFEAANIYARASGYVLKRYVDIGDRVKAGQLLAEITAPEVEAQVAQYQNSLQQLEHTTQQNEANRSLAAVTWDRDSVLVKQGWVTQQQGDTDRYNLQAQQQAVRAAQGSAAATQAQLEYYNQQKIYQQVVAPFDGVITQRNIDVGSLITADATSGTSMFSIVQSDVIRVWVYVPQDSAFGVGPGVDAVIRVPAMPDLTFHGKVTRIANALQPGTRTLLTEVDIPNQDGALQPGVYCTVELKIPRKSPALIVPASAIIFNQSGMQVAVVEDGVARLHKIAITTDYGNEVEVNEGVKDGNKVILQPPVNLAEGDKVRIIPEPPAAAPQSGSK
jgi:RND family efflux transporter MFP subunit